MKANLKSWLLSVVGVCCIVGASAQPTDPTRPNSNTTGGNTGNNGGGAPTTTVTESGGTESQKRDGVYDRNIYKDKRVLPYDHIREGDVFFEKRVWRIIDVREKMNLPFKFPKEPFIQILLGFANDGTITVFGNADDEFKNPLKKDEVNALGGSVDTIITYDPDTFEEKVQVVTNQLNPEDVKRFRLKEIWFFDEETSTLMVRILGVAPIIEKYDDNGNFMFETPMFWAYYPDLRPLLARHEAFNPMNDAVKMTWEDIFEMRYFSSYITKSSNVYDRRIQDYKKGVDILFESEKLKNEIFNFEHDLWQY